MKRVYLADAHPDERRALRLLLGDLNMEIAGEAVNWATLLVQAPAARTDMILVDWGVVSGESSTSLLELRKACGDKVKIVLLSPLDARAQAALSSGADTFICKGETSERIIEYLQAAVNSLVSN